MENLHDLYILGQPIETKVGNLRFIKVKEYPQLLQHISLLMFDKKDMVAPLDKETRELLKDVPFIQLIKNSKLEFGYRRMLEFFFNEENAFDLIETDEDFEEIRALIKKMNIIKYEKPNPNPEIARFDFYSKLMKKRKGEEITFETMYTSVWLYIGHVPDELTLYQFHALFSRVAQFKNYDTSTLFATVSKDAKIDPWYKGINMFEEEKKISLEEFSKNQKNKLSL